MIQKTNHQYTIYNFIAVFLILLIGIAVFNLNRANAKEDEEKNLVIDYEKFEPESTRQAADDYFEKADSQEDSDSRKEYLKKAAAKYYILSNIDKSDSYPCIRLARVYDKLGKDSYAKAYFYRALGLNYKDTEANIYFAEFYFSRKQYKKAIEYYQKAIAYGYEATPETYKKMGMIYERFGDVKRAVYYYKESLNLNPQDEEIGTKLQELESIDYQNTGYYKRRLRS